MLGSIGKNWATVYPTALRGLVRAMQSFGRSLEQSGEILAKGWLALTADAVDNDFLLDRNGKCHCEWNQAYEEKCEVIYGKTLAMLPYS